MKYSRLSSSITIFGDLH